MSDDSEQTAKRAKRLGPFASRRTFLKGTGALAVTAGIGAGNVTAGGDGPSRVVGYYASWASDYGPEDVPFDRLTHLAYAFLEPESDGTVVLGNPNNDSLIQDLAANSDGDTELQFSISGGWYPQEFSDAASTWQNRQRFAETAVDHVVNYGFDGIDLDWEYPDGTTHPDDPDNFEMLVDAVRSELDNRVGTDAPLTLAASANSSTSDDAYNDGIFQHLTHVNVMNYDYNGDWSNETNFNAPFELPSDDPSSREEWSVTDTMDYWSGRVADEDLVMGMPFYGYSFTGVPSTNDGLYQSFDSASSETYSDIQSDIKPQTHYDEFWHDEAEVPWLYSAQDEIFISYDNEASVQNKCDFVNANDFGGVMCWELSQDASNTLITVMHDAMQGDSPNGKFAYDDRTVTTGDLSVRAGPGTSHTRLDVASEDTTGRVVGGPETADGYTWWEIEYEDGVENGWSAENWLDHSRFKVGDQCVSTDLVWVRDGPSTSYDHIDSAPSDSYGTITDGPVENDDHVWWQVDWDGNVLTGWVAQGESWLVPA